MTDHAQVIDQLKRDEGFVPHAYKDSLGYLTLGYGFLVDERKGGRIPSEVADHWLEWEVSRLSTLLTQRINCYADQPEEVKAALLNMAYQMGWRGLLGFSKMLAALEAGDREQAAREALDSRWAAQTPERAQRVAAMIRGGK